MFALGALAFYEPFGSVQKVLNHRVTLVLRTASHLPYKVVYKVSYKVELYVFTILINVLLYQ